MPNTEIMEKLSKVAEGVKAVQEANDRLEKKYDVLDVEQIEKASDAASKAYEAAQAIEQKMEAMGQEAKERMEAIELAIARGTDGKDPHFDSEYKGELVKYMRRGTLIDDEMLEKNCRMIAEKALVGVDPDQIEHFTKDLVAGSGSDGGYFLTPERSSEISKRIFETSNVRSVANVVSTAADVFEVLLDDDEFGGGWVGEVSSRPDTTTGEIGLVKIPVHELYAQPKVTQKMIDDAGFDLEAWVSDKVARKLGRLESTAFVTGDGSQKPKGFLSYDAWASAGTY